MNRHNSPSLTILGGGPAGLAAGYYARQRDLDIQVLEANDQVGGNARTLRSGPFRFDTGAHRLHDKIPHVTATFKKLIGDDLRLIHAPSQIYWRKRFIDFPLSPYNLAAKLPARTLLQIAWEQLKMLPCHFSSPRHFREMAMQAYGPTLARHFLLNYSTKLWGVSTDRLSTRVAGSRLKGLDLKTFLLEALAGKRKKTRHLDGSFYYPKKGFGSLFEAVADATGREHIQCSARVTRLEHDGRRITRVVVNDEEVIAPDTLVSTLPLPVVLRLLTPAPPTELLQVLETLRFRSLRLGLIGLDRSRLTPNASLYFPDAELPFTRIYEPKNRSSHLTPPDQTLLVVEAPCYQTDACWKIKAASFTEQLIDQLTQLDLIDSEEVVHEDSFRVPFAYPVLETGFEDKIRPLVEYLQDFDNLHLLGRGAQFQYTHTHNLFEGARALIEDLTAESASLTPVA